MIKSINFIIPNVRVNEATLYNIIIFKTNTRINGFDILIRAAYTVLRT